MSVFSYVAINEKGRTRKGILEGDSPSQIRKTLVERGLTPVEITQSEQQTLVTTAAQTGYKRFFSRGDRVSITSLAMVTYQFSTLLSAGLTVEAALANMAQEMDNATLKRVLMSVRARLMEGHPLAYGLREYPSVFPNLYTASVAVGEKTGQLERVLFRLADYYEKQKAVRDKIFQAMIYPSLLTLVASGIVIFLLTYVIPQVTDVFTESGQELPGITVLLLAASAFLQAWGLYILGVMVVGAIVFRYSVRHYLNFRKKVQQFLLKLPIVGSTIIAVNAARFTRTFGILFAAGVPVIEAMNSANSIITLISMHDSIQAAIGKVGEGTAISQALGKTGFFSSLSNQLIASGEQSGELEGMLEKAANFQETNTSNKISTALALFEPILILTMGAIVLFIVLAVLLPIFQMNQLVS